jgi:hypothetical protein
MMEPSSILVEWLSNGRGTGSFQQLISGLKASGILSEDCEANLYKNLQYRLLRDLSDCSILDFGDGGKWTVQSTRIAVITQDATSARAVLCGARDSRTHMALRAMPAEVQVEPLGHFGVQLVGTLESIEQWARDFDFANEPCWVPIQVNNALEQLGSSTTKRASEPNGPLPVPIVREGPCEIRRLENDFRREIVNSLPTARTGTMLEVVERYTSRRIRYVGTPHGWLRAHHYWAPWICAAGVDCRIAKISNQSLSIPLWARLPDGLSRAVTLSSTTPWDESDGRLISGTMPKALLYNLKRILSLG